MRLLIVVVLCLLLVGCATPVEVQPIIEQESLLEYCTYDTPELKNPVLNEKGEPEYNGKQLLNLAVEWQSTYNECAALHDKLVDTIKDLQKVKRVSY